MTSGVINNISLGGEYLVIHKSLAPEFFDKLSKEVKNDDSLENLAGFVRSAAGEAFPFYGCNKNYITERGGTIERL